MDRTVRIQLHPTPEQAIALQETLRQFTEAFNQVCAYGWQQHEKNGVRLHHATYCSTKEACPGLVSDLLIQARVKATEALKSAFTWKARHEASYPRRVAKALKRGKPAPQFKPVKCPHSKSCPIRYHVHTSTLNWQRSTVRLSTSAGKQSIPFVVPAYCAKYAGGTVCTADLCYRKGKKRLTVVTSASRESCNPTDRNRLRHISRVCRGSKLASTGIAIMSSPSGSSRTLSPVPRSSWKISRTFATITFR